MASTAGTPGAVAVPHVDVALSRWWRVVGGMLMNLALGSLYAWSVFVAPLEKEFGWKRADTSQVFTWAVVVFAISFILAGRLQDKKGPFFISLTGCILLTIGFLLEDTLARRDVVWIGFLSPRPNGRLACKHRQRDCRRAGNNRKVVR